MPLAGHESLVAGVTEDFGERRGFRGNDTSSVPQMEQSPACQEHRPTWHAHRRVRTSHDVRPGERASACCQAVQMGRFDNRLPQGMNRVESLVIGQKEKDIRPRVGVGFSPCGASRHRARNTPAGQRKPLSSSHASSLSSAWFAALSSTVPECRIIMLTFPSANWKRSVNGERRSSCIPSVRGHRAYGHRAYGLGNSVSEAGRTPAPRR